MSSRDQKGTLKNVTVLVGVNGSGKTSILRAIALGVLAPIINESGYRPYYLVRMPKSGNSDSIKGEVTVEGVLDKRERNKLSHSEGSGSTPNELMYNLEITRRNDYDVLRFAQLPSYRGKSDLPKNPSTFDMHDARAFVYNRSSGMATDRQLYNALNEYYNDYSASFFLLGYGASRRVEDPRRATLASADKDRGRRYLRVASLFEEGITLIPFAAWLPQLKTTDRFEEVVKLLNKTLPAGTRFTGEFHKDQHPLFTHNGVSLPFPALSDGYRSYVGLLGDILCHLNDCRPKGTKLVDLTGVIMVDDIDLHLHPQWQRVVVPRLAKALPKIQFILTTHSPLVAGTVHALNVRVIGKNEIHEFSEQLHGLSVDQILSSQYFGYTNPRSDESEKKLQELLEGPIDEGDASLALQFLKKLTGRDQIP